MFLNIKENILHLEGEDKLWLPKEKYFYFCKLGNETFFPKYYYYPNYDFQTMFGKVSKARIVTFDIKLDIKKKENLQFFLSFMGTNIEIITFFNLYTHIPTTKNSYYISDNYIIKKNNNDLVIYAYNSNLENDFEKEYCLELKNYQKDYLIKYRQNYLKYKIKIKIQYNRQIWLINDRKDLAGDNGEYFFRYLKKIQPKNITFYYIIENKCSDYKRLEKFNNIIAWNSSDHLNLFLKADKIFSSLSDSWVNNAFGEDGKYMTDLYHFDYIYLQNGIIKDDLSSYLNRNSKHFDLLITSSKKEYKSLLKSSYGYKEDNLLITGLPRFDNLIKINKRIKKKKIILIFPTWRTYIKGVRDLITLKSIKSDKFTNTTFFNFYNELINNQQLLEKMRRDNYFGIFCLHPNFAGQRTYFKENNIFSVKENCNQQELFVESSILITDYSNIFFDFGYMLKPILYTHFDYNEYRNNQYPQGYFDYKKDGFGQICYDIECSIKAIISIIETKCKLKKRYIKRIKKFFNYFDDENSNRVYIAINKRNFIDKIQENLLKLKLYIIIILIILKFLNTKKISYFFI